MVLVSIESQRSQILQEEFSKDYFEDLVVFLHERQDAGAIIYPPGSDIFRAFDLTPWNEVRVVILGQDPYHGPGQAHGLAFSVQEGVSFPPSLKNIFIELEHDVGARLPTSGDLSPRAKQGVLLLNTTLTVEAGQPLSHRGEGREKFTDAVIDHISREKQGIIFLLWGGHAKSKQTLIDPVNHYILTAPHPSPLSAYRGRFGSKHFSQTNELLVAMGKEPIRWVLS